MTVSQYLCRRAAAAIVLLILAAPPALGQQDCEAVDVNTVYNDNGVEVVEVSYRCSNGASYVCTYVIYGGGSSITRSCGNYGGDWIPIEDPAN